MILDSGYIEVHACVDISEVVIVILDLHYDGQQVGVDKMPTHLERQIEDLEIKE